jgi:hypothetical protein
MKHRAASLFTAGFAVMLAAGWTGLPRTLYRSDSQPVNFNHRIHKDKASQKCADCHTLTADGTFTGTPALASCSACHTEPMGTTANEKTFIAAYVKPGREVAWRPYARQPMNVRFSHSVHVNLGKLACAQCHGGHGETTKVAMHLEDRISGYNAGTMTMSACEDCHRQRGIEAGCLGCHR